MLLAGRLHRDFLPWQPPSRNSKNYVKLQRHSAGAKRLETAICDDIRPELHIVATYT
jgi:hypothetical protein